MSGTDGAAKQAKSFAKPLKHGKSLLKAAYFAGAEWAERFICRAMTSRPTVQAAPKSIAVGFLTTRDAYASVGEKPGDLQQGFDGGGDCGLEAEKAFPKNNACSERGSILKGQGLAAADDMEAFYFVILRQEDCFATKTFIFNRFLRRSG